MSGFLMRMVRRGAGLPTAAPIRPPHVPRFPLDYSAIGEQTPTSNGTAMPIATPSIPIVQTPNVPGREPLPPVSPAQSPHIQPPRTRDTVDSPSAFNAAQVPTDTAGTPTTPTPTPQIERLKSYEKPYLTHGGNILEVPEESETVSDSDGALRAPSPAPRSVEETPAEANDISLRPRKQQEPSIRVHPEPVVSTREPPSPQSDRSDITSPEETGGNVFLEVEAITDDREQQAAPVLPRPIQTPMHTQLAVPTTNEQILEIERPLTTPKPRTMKTEQTPQMERVLQASEPQTTEAPAPVFVPIRPAPRAREPQRVLSRPLKVGSRTEAAMQETPTVPATAESQDAPTAPAVHVRIGTVEVRATRPAPPSAPVAPQKAPTGKSGFESYASIRRYAIREDR